MTAAILARGAEQSGLQACRDVESEKIDEVNELIQRFSGRAIDRQLGDWVNNAGCLRVGRLTLLSPLWEETDAPAPVRAKEWVWERAG